MGGNKGDCLLKAQGLDHDGTDGTDEGPRRRVLGQWAVRLEGGQVGSGSKGSKEESVLLLGVKASSLPNPV